jgi:hypothetical protein
MSEDAAAAGCQESLLTFVKVCTSSSSLSVLAFTCNEQCTAQSAWTYNLPLYPMHWVSFVHNIALTTPLVNRHVHLQNVYRILLEFINLRVLSKHWIRGFEVEDINMFVAS